MVKGFRQIASLTFVSRIFGMLRDVAFAAFFGASVLTDAWYIAFKIPNLARRLFGEGAASASFIPVYSEVLQKDKAQASRLANTVVTVIFILLSAVVVLGLLGILGYRLLFDENDQTKLILSLCSLMLPYMVMICTVAILAGILNVHRHFAAPAAAPIVLNIFIILSVVLTGWLLDISKVQQLFVVAVAVLLAGLVQIAMQLKPLKAAGVSLRPEWDVHSQAFKKIILLMGPMILGLTVTQINTLADDLIALLFSSSVEKGEILNFLGREIKYPLTSGSVTYLYYAQRLYQLPLGVFGISLATAIFPVMSDDAARGDHQALSRTISKGLKGTVFVAVPAMVGLFLVAGPLVMVLFQRGSFDAVDTAGVSYTLIFYAIGLTGFFAQQILTRAFYSLHDSKMPARSAMIAVMVNIVLNFVLIWPLGTAGLALSTALCSYLQVAILVVALKRRLGSSVLDGFGINFAKTALGSVVMGLCGGGVLWLLKDVGDLWVNEFVRLVVVVAVCITVYSVLAKILKNSMLSMIIGGKKA